MTQAERIVQAIRRKPMTWGEIEALRISTCPWVRLQESGHRFLRPGEAIVRKMGRDGLVRIKVERVDQFCYFAEQGDKARKAMHGRG